MRPWVTSDSNPDVSSAYAAYASSEAILGRTEMITPMFVVAPDAQITFRNAFNLDHDLNDPEVGFDGMVLEISINGGPFQDIVSAGGTFVTGGYTRTISSNFGSPLSGRRAWSGLSAGTATAPSYVTTTISMPTQSFGQLVRVRWVVAADNRWSAGEASGAWIDTVIFSPCTTTAVGAEIAGRVTTPDGRGLRNAKVTISDASGRIRSVSTGSFGYYRFTDVESGRTYVLSVESRRYRFASRVLPVPSTVLDVNFAGLE
jgi:Carboxypeptidase regulatory-like domain